MLKMPWTLDSHCIVTLRNGVNQRDGSSDNPFMASLRLHSRLYQTTIYLSTGNSGKWTPESTVHLIYAINAYTTGHPFRRTECEEIS
jgi:hypothetical protein